MGYWELVFWPKSAEDIHGVNLREAIRRAAVKIGIESGHVRNNKKDGTVRVLCQENDEGKVKSLYESITEKPPGLAEGKIDGKKSYFHKITYSDESKAPKFQNGFEIIREDELSEMVWALQAAGKVFSSVEERRMNAFNAALKYGISYISSCADELRTNHYANRKFVLLAIDHYITECPSDDPNMIELLYQLHELCEYANTMDASIVEKELDNALNRILKICNEIDKKLSHGY